MQLSLMTWPQVEDYLKSSQTVIIPIGSSEQHGPTGLINTDYSTADAIAIEAGRRQKILVAPPLCFGMAIHHLAFPGTIALTPETYVRVITDIVQSLVRHGFQKLHFVNGHGGNMAPATTAFCQFKTSNSEAELSLHNWWILPEVKQYEDEYFGEENGFHATVSEVAVTKFLFQEAFTKIPDQNFKAEMPDHHWPMGAEEFRRWFPDGRMGSNPGRATVEHGKKIFEIAVDSLCQRIQK